MTFALDENPKELMQLDREDRATATAKQISTYQTLLLDSQTEIAEFVERGYYQQVTMDYEVTLFDVGT